MIEEQPEDHNGAGNEPHKRTQQHQRRLKRYRILLPILVVVAFIVWGFTINYVPSESMLPTLEPGDYILTMKSWLAYPRGAMPKRGDIIIFALPEGIASVEVDKTDIEKRSASFNAQKDLSVPAGSLKHLNGEVLVKRVVGLPGDEVQIIGPQIYINGKLWEQGYFKAKSISPDSPVNFGVYQPIYLSGDELFVLGDNFDNSDDSRTWGPLLRKNVVGKFVRIIRHVDVKGIPTLQVPDQPDQQQK